MTNGNKALRDHRLDGRAVRLFTGTGGAVTYEGEFELATEQPYVERTAHSTHEGPDRRVFVFRLRPRQPSVQSGTGAAKVASVPIAQQNVETWSVSPGQTTKASAIEANLVKSYRDYLTAKGDTIVRHRYPSSSGYLFNDLYNESRNQLVEAKGSTRRPDIRMAIGQLLGYSELEESAHLMGLLVPHPLADDLLELLNGLGIAVVWPEGAGFRDTASGAFI